MATHDIVIIGDYVSVMVKGEMDVSYFKQITDEFGVEDVAGSSTGLGLIEIETRLEKQKILKEVQGKLLLNDNAEGAYRR